MIPSLVVVLAEDQRHQRFVREYLYRKGISRHAIRMAPLPSGRGSGEQWVRESYPQQVRAYRQRSVKAKTWLIVVVDADIYSVEWRVRQLRDALGNDSQRERRENEAIVHLIPKRNIETWILCLNGSAVDEDTDYRHEPDIDEMIAGAATAFFDLSRPHAVIPSRFVASLIPAVPEMRRLD